MKRLQSVRQIQSADVSNGAPQLTLQYDSDLLAEFLVFKNQSTYIGLAVVVYDQKTPARHQRIGVHIEEISDLSPNCFYAVFSCLGPDRRPIRNTPATHQGVVPQLHAPNR